MKGEIAADPDVPGGDSVVSRTANSCCSRSRKNEAKEIVRSLYLSCFDSNLIASTRRHKR